jgi:hypothetical protein
MQKTIKTRLMELLIHLKYNEYLSLQVIYYVLGAKDYIAQAHIRGVLNRNTPGLFRRSQFRKGRYQLSAQGKSVIMY